MRAWERVRDAFARGLSEASGGEASPTEVAAALAVPEDLSRGDLAFPCFPLAKRRRQPPPKVAQEIAAAVSVPGVARCEAAGGYVNAFLDRPALARETLADMAREGDRYGGSDAFAGKVAVVEYSSPNVGKAFGIHHLRSTMIGHSLARLLETQGYKVVRINYLGDWGTQFGSLIAAVKRYGTPEAGYTPEGLMGLYARFHQEAQTDPSLEGAARDEFRRLEEGDLKSREYWEQFREANLREFDRIYGLLGVTFDEVFGESDPGYEAKEFGRPMLSAEEHKQVLRKQGEWIESWLLGKSLLTQSEGAQVVAFPDRPEWPPLIVRKSDGATKYDSRDLVSAFRRHERHRFDRMLYVVDVAQTLHFQQVFEVLRRAGCDWVRGCEHVVFGRYQGMSTRKGTFVLLQDVLEQAVARAKEKIESAKKEGLVSIPDEAIEGVAKQVGIGAVVFNDLKTRRIKDVTFDWDDLMNFQGRTGPYLQYAYARIQGILRKAGGDGAGAPIGEGVGAEPAEHAVVRHLARFPEHLRRAAADSEPSIVATALLDLATDFSRFYESCPVLQAPPAQRAARLALVRAVATVLRRGLVVLGLETPERM